MKPCEKYAALLDMYVDGFCTDEETAQVRKHLAECEGCRMHVAQILQMKEAFPDAEEEKVPDGFAEGVMAAIRAESASQKKRMKPWQRTLLQMAACIAVVIALGPLSARLTGGESAQDAAMEMSMAGTASKAQAPSTPSAPSVAWDAKSEAKVNESAADQNLSPVADGAEKPAEEAPEYGRAAEVKLTRSQMTELLSGFEGTERNGGVVYVLTAAELEAVLVKIPTEAVMLDSGLKDAAGGSCLLTVYPTE